MITLPDRLPPSIIAILFLATGLVLGWIGHANWSLRGEADQLVEDIEIGIKIEQDKEVKDTVLETNIEATRNDIRFTSEDCLNYSNVDYVRSLRNSSREEISKYNSEH